MSLWLLWLGKGLAFGLAGAGVNHCLLMRALRRAEAVSPKKGKNILLGCYLKRYVVNLITLLVAYFLISSNVLFLIGTAFGLTIPKYIYAYRGLTKQQLGNLH
jgi:hypothetical protein